MIHYLRGMEMIGLDSAIRELDQPSREKVELREMAELVKKFRTLSEWMKPILP
jgi:hypothetical protein